MEEDARCTAILRGGHAPSQPTTPMWGTDEYLGRWGRNESKVKIKRGVYTLHALEYATQVTEIYENTRVWGANFEDGNVEVGGHATGQALKEDLRDTGNIGPKHKTAYRISAMGSEYTWGVGSTVVWSIAVIIDNTNTVEWSFTVNTESAGKMESSAGTSKSAG